MPENVNTSRKKVAKRPISPKLKAMKIGDVVEFPIDQTYSIRNEITRIQLLNDDMRFSTKTEDKKCLVTRESASEE